MRTPARFDLVNVEPYTSELYSTLFEPSVKTLEENYVRRVSHVLRREDLYKAMLFSSAKSVLLGVSRSVFTVALRNITLDYQSQPRHDRPPVDIFFLKYYTNPRNYTQMFCGLSSELKVEISFAMCRGALASFAKYVAPSNSDSFLTNIGVSLGRTFSTYWITAFTVYPLSLYSFANCDAETLMNRTFHKAGSGSVKAALMTVGFQIGSSVFPSY
jgi:hypothetical protein